MAAFANFLFQPNIGACVSVSGKKGGKAEEEGASVRAKILKTLPPLLFLMRILRYLPFFSPPLPASGKEGDFMVEVEVGG